MTRTVLLAVILSVAAGLLIELFFRVVKYRDALSKEAPRPMTAYGMITDASNYMSVSQYLSGGERRWLNYFLFRLLPPFLIFILLAGVIARYLDVPSNPPYLLLSAAVSLIPRDVASLFKARRVSEKLLHITNILFVLVSTLPIWLLSGVVDLSPVAPSMQGLVDNLWSSLFVAMLILLYLQMTNMGARQKDQIAEDIALSNYVVKAYARIKNRYGPVIQTACVKYNCSIQILYAVLIYEDMNRPACLRKFENIIVRFSRLTLTVGIAQVRSNKSLTDKESIRRAAKILEGSTYTYANSRVGDGFSDIQQLKNVLKSYNQSKLYAESVSQIISKLRIYASEIFPKGQV